MNYLRRFEMFLRQPKRFNPPILTPLRGLSHYPLMRFFILNVFFQFTLFDIRDKFAIALFFHVF